MKIQTRLSIFSSIAFGVVFAIISIIIYSLYAQRAEKSVYSNLEKIAYITAFFFLEEDELNRAEFAKVQHQFEQFVASNQFQIYNDQNKVSYGDKKLLISEERLDKVRSKERLAFEEDESFCYGIFYKDNQGDFVIVAHERKDVLNEQKQQLLWILLLSFITGMVAIVILSRWVSRRAYRPFSNVIKEVNNISIKNLNVQIASPETKDELQNLTDTFNNLLSRISETFIIQRNFVSYVSHEFKTPLASMLGNFEVFSLKDRTPQEYRQLSEKMIQQIYQMEEILNTLMVLSDLRENVDMNLPVRVDELIWRVIEKVSERHSNTKVSVQSNIPAEHEQLLSVTTDNTQLFMALFNLIENGVKYSNGKVLDIDIFEEDGKLHVSIADKGIGISKEQLPHINKPFYRADNASKIQGSGIGLSIALRILERSNIRYRITSQENIGTTILLTF